MIGSISYMKIIMSLGMIAFAGALVVGGTRAFFSDTETSVGNTFAAGAIDLQIDNSSYGFDWNDPTATNPVGDWGQNTANSWALTDLTDELFFNFVDLKPGDYGEDTISLHVDNNDSYACMAFALAGTPENGQNEPEAAVDATAGVDEGELQNYLSFLFWMDDGDNILEVGETIIDDLSGLADDNFTGNWLAIAEGGDTPLPAETTQYLGKGWCFGDIAEDREPQDGVNTAEPTADTTGFSCTGAAGDHNDAQTDGIAVDVSFYAVQSRNNDDFSCAALPPLVAVDPNRPLVGAVAFAYTEPELTSCDLTVDENVVTDTATEFDTLIAAEAAATADQTICVDTGTYTEDVTIDVAGLTILGFNDPKGADKATIDGRIDVDVDGVTISGLELTNPDASYSIVINGVSDTEISDNSLVDIGTTLALGSAQAIYYNGGATAESGLLISGNMINNVGNLTMEKPASGSSAKGIFIGDSTAPSALSGVVIEDNVIMNIFVSTADWPVGRGAYGVLINFGAGVTSPVINNNTISTLEGLWAHAIGLETDTPGASVTRNDISDVVDHKGSIDAIGVFFEGNPGGATTVVNENNFGADIAAFAVAIHPSDPVYTVDAEDNWWGDVTPADEVFEASGTIDYTPFEASAFPNN